MEGHESLENQEENSNNSRKYVVLLYFIAAIIGFAGFLRSYPLDFISGREGFYWGDHAHYVSGYFAYRDSPWRLPILWTDKLNYPTGINIGNTDSIPLVALLLKPFRSILPPDFHYFGLWYLVAYLLQSVGAVFLFRQMGLSRWWYAVLAACFALLTPIFIYRGGHTALTTQGLVLIALGLYFQATNKTAPARPSRYWYVIWALLVGASFLIQPYLTAMIVPVYWAAVLDITRGRNSWRKMVVAVIAPVVMLVVLYFCFWYMPNNPLGDAVAGYGTGSLNLLSPFVGGALIHWGSQFQSMPWQAVEGQNYFGLGVLGIILAAVWLQRACFKQAFLKHRCLIILFIGLIIYALSNEVYAGELQILSFPEWLAGYVRLIGDYFRVSGRLFWPVGYAILFASLFAVLSNVKKWVIWFVLAMLIVQYFDVPKSYFGIFITGDAITELDFPRHLWESLLSGKRELYLTPAWDCGGGWEIPPLQMLAAKNHVLVNTAYTARQSPNCKRKSNDDQADLKAGSVHFYSNTIYRNQVENWMGSQAADWCRRFSRGIVCVPYPNATDLEILNSDTFLPFFTKNIQSFIGNKLPGEVGEVYFTSRMAQLADPPGYLVRGPYIQLPAGTYFFQLKYHSTQSARTPIGRLEPYSDEYIHTSNHGILKQYQLSGTNGQKSTLSGSFDLPEDLQSGSFELRVFWDGNGDLTVDQIIIYQLDT
jgi:hypothetical protein